MISLGVKITTSAVLGAMAIFGISEASATITKDEEVEEPIKYTVETIYDSTKREGTTEITQEGKNGSKKVTYSVTYNHDKEVKRSIKSEKTIEPAVKQIVVKGTKKYYTCSDGTEYDNITDKNECENKIAWAAKRDQALQECYADRNKFNCWYDQYPGTTIHWTEYTYSAPSYTPSYSPSAPSTNSNGRTGAICRDGWRSSATGRGACSHHGGVSYWL